jgi:flavin reductase (DIM6/NTAB) family NADH-FMN oxidoreductase RutF
MNQLDVGNLTRNRSPVDDRTLRAVCGNFVTGVTVVTTSFEGNPVGVTINSFTSVSLSPPLILFCIHQESTVQAALRRSGVFAVTILAEDQAELCHSFAKQATARIADVMARPALTGAPVLLGGLAYLDCRVVSQHPGGDHWIVVGEVLDTGLLRDGKPLTFFRNAHPRLEPSS